MGLVWELHAPTHRLLVFFELQRFRFTADRYLKTQGRQGLGKATGRMLIMKTVMRTLLRLTNRRTQ